MIGDGCHRLAVVSYKQLGDVLLLQPALSALAERTGNPVTLATKPEFSALVRLMPGAALEREARFDLLACVHHGSKAVWSSLKLRAEKKLLFLTRAAHLRWYHRWVFHECIVSPQRDTYWALQHWHNLVGTCTDGYHEPALMPPPPEWRPQGFQARDYILIHPTAAWPKKFWTAENWAETIRYLDRHYGRPLIMTGGGTDFEMRHLKTICDYGAPITNYGGKTSLEEFIFLVAQARAVIAIDGAASHIARAYNKPVVTLFGQTNPRKWSTATRPWQRIAESEQKQGEPEPAASIRVAAVTAQIDRAFTEFERSDP
jgi:ADP-heptose:LPS heptosyltransferase